MIKVLISLVTYTNHEVTKKCLKSLETIETKDIQVDILIINNDVTKPFTSEKGKIKMTILNQTRNLGFSGGHNLSLKYAMSNDYTYVLVLNNDTILTPTFLIDLIKAGETYPKGGAFAPLIYFAPGHEFHKARYTDKQKGKVIWYGGGIIDWQNMLLSHRGVDEVDHGQYMQDEETDFVSGCCMLLRTATLKKSGIFDDRYFLYLEDSDLNMRIKQAGFTTYFIPGTHIWHENAGSTGGSGSLLQDYYISRNRLLFGFTYAPFRTKLALFRESVKMLRAGRKWQKQGIQDFYLRKFGKGSYRV